MFDNHKLIRIYYALAADKERREQSEHADMYQGEIGMNIEIMKQITDALPHLNLTWIAPEGRKHDSTGEARNQTPSSTVQS